MNDWIKVKPPRGLKTSITATCLWFSCRGLWGRQKPLYSLGAKALFLCFPTDFKVFGDGCLSLILFLAF